MPIQQWSEQIWVVKLADEPSLSEDLLMALSNAASAQRAPDIVLDLAGVNQINSSNLSQVLRLRKMAIDRGTRLRLAAPTDPVWAVFITTGLDKVLEFAHDVPTALAGLQMGR